MCAWTYRDHGLTTYKWLFREKNRYTIMSCCLFLSANAPKIKSCRLVQKEEPKCYTLTLAPLYLYFKLKLNWFWLKLKIEPDPRKKSVGPVLGLDMPATS
jgi:hypothetical protein